MIYHYLFSLVTAFFIIILYYKYGKSIIIFYTPYLAKLFQLTYGFPFEDIKGALELALIALSHVLFCALLICFVPIHWISFKMSWQVMPVYFVYGILLGIGCLCVSMLFSKIVIQLINTFCNHSYDLKTWLTLSRGGWVKHHLQSIEIFPVYLSMLILLMQLGSEEIIFRGVLLQYFMQFGTTVSFITSVTFFILMQFFLMNRWEAIIFPMIGALVMGLVHSILFLQIPVFWPLIISHITFFLFSII